MTKLNGGLSADLSGKRALVTGGSSGLGRQFAKVLAANGADVTVAARRVSKLDETAADILATGGAVSVLALDVTDADAVAAAFLPADTPYDIVVNNAGIAFDGPALQTGLADWKRVIDTDLTGVFQVAQAVAAQMSAHKSGGSIINIASILGRRVSHNLAAYAAAKAGVVQLTRSLALEWARFGIRVNTICPGYILTDINREYFESGAGDALIKRIPQRRLGDVSDLDGPLLLLASDASRFMTGTELVADGGHLVTSL